MSLSKTKAIEVAKYLIWLGQNERPDEPLYLTPMQVQKILFYAQGWTVAEWDKPLFDDDLEAWTEGPVVDQVWRVFKAFGPKPITDESHADDSGLSEVEKHMVRQVWDTYKQYSAWALSDMTHEDPAWLGAREGLARNAAAKRKITLEAMKRSFLEKLQAVENELAQNWDAVVSFASENTRRITGKPAI